MALPMTMEPMEMNDRNAGQKDALGPAVLIRNAYKEYCSRSPIPFQKTTRNLVIKGLNMTVRRGTIYGLLGASGCGKTTVLRCIVGLDYFTDGELQTLGRTPGAPGSGVPGTAVGYMPQEMALYIDFTIAETFRYFAWMTGISNELLATRLTSLLSFLDLPPAHSKVGDLSGGQQRRVSLAVALLHEPRLLLLDEPTVGLDPVLRDRVWERLMDITADGRTTVIITTHYIDEARRAHALGLMRNGVLLAEEAPASLLDRLGCTSMEEAFLQLSMRQSSGEQLDDSHSPTSKHVDDHQAVPVVSPYTAQVPVEDGSQFTTSSASHVACLLWKQGLALWKNRMLMFFVILLPIVQSALFGTAIGRDPRGLKLAVTNEDGDCSASADLEDLATFDCSNPSLLSCRYLSLLREMTFETIPFGSVEEAMESVRQGGSWAALHIPSNFTTNMFARINDGEDATNNSLVGSEMSVWRDNSNSYIGSLIQFDMTHSTVNLLQKMMARCDFNPAVADIPVRFEKPLYGNFDDEFSVFVAPGFILVCVYFFALASSLFSIMSEKKEGLLDRSLVMGVTLREMMWSHMATHSIIMLVQVVIVLVAFLSVMQIPCDGPLFWVIALSTLQGFCGVCMGIFMSCLTDIEFAATILAMGCHLLSCFTNGMMWPVEGMHPLLRLWWWVLPVSLPTTSMRLMMARGWSPSLQHPEVLFGFISTVLWIVAFLGCTLFLLRTRRR